MASSTSRRGRGWWGLHIFKSKEKEEERRLWPHSATRLTPPTLTPPHYPPSHTLIHTPSGETACQRKCSRTLGHRLIIHRITQESSVCLFVCLFIRVCVSVFVCCWLCVFVCVNVCCVSRPPWCRERQNFTVALQTGGRWAWPGTEPDDVRENRLLMTSSSPSLLLWYTAGLSWHLT